MLFVRLLRKQFIWVISEDEEEDGNLSGIRLRHLNGQIFVCVCLYERLRERPKLLI